MKKEQDLMQKIVSLCKRRGFIFSSSDIYGGFAAIYDFGPYGTELEKHIKNEWWKTMVQLREDIVGLDSSIFMHPKIWEASGHVSGFSDPLAECKNCHSRLRVDHLLEDVGVFADEKMTCPVSSFDEPGVFHDFQPGWNNATFCIKNRGDHWVEMGMFVTMLPEGWAMIWDYDGSPIEPGSTVKVVVSVFCAYRIPVDSLMLGVNLKYRVVDGE